MLRLRSSWRLDRHPDVQGTFVHSSSLGDEDLRERLSVSNSLRSGTDVRDGGPAYAVGARVPSEDWLRLTDDALMPDARSPSVEHPGDYIGLEQVPAEIVDELVILGQAARLDRAKLEKLAQELISGLGARYIASGDLAINGIRRARSGLHTATTGRSGQRTGLHVDSWESNLLDGRRHARNRVCLNIGTNDRGFLFMSTPIDVVSPLVNGVRIPEDLFHADVLRTPSVFRLLVKPGEAYIAPTECLIHDGETMGQSHDDVTFTFRMKLMPRIILDDRLI